MLSTLGWRSIVASGALALVLMAGFFFEAQFQQNVIHVAILDGLPSKSLELALDKWPARMGELHIHSFSYEDLRVTLMDPEQLKQFDAVMVDDPWLADLAERDQLAPVSFDVFRDEVLSFVPEFLRVCYYKRASILTQRRPPLARMTSMNRDAAGQITLKVDESKIRDIRDYSLYALPYVGNVQMLVSRAQALRQPESWTEIEKDISIAKASFSARLGSNNSALADFLPLLWAAGGCLLGFDGSGEVSGFSSDGREIAVEAFQKSADLARANSVQYTRFLEEDISHHLLTAPKTVGIAWLAYGLKPGQDDLQAYVLPAVLTTQKSKPRVCSGDPEDGDEIFRRTGALGLWSLAVPKETVNPGAAWEFIRWALKQLKEDKAPVGACEPSARLAINGDNTSPFEDHLTCGGRTLIRHSRPRISDPDWKQIEAAVGFRVRQAHWRAREIGEIVNEASRDLKRILEDRQRQDN
jgi:hypothetical protein